MVFIAPSSPSSTDSDALTGGEISKLVLKLDRESYRRNNIRTKALKLLGGHPGVQSVAWNEMEETFELVGDGVDPNAVTKLLRKKFGYAKIMSRGLATARSDTFPTIVRISELKEQSERQQEDQPPPGRADSYISRVESSPLSHPFPSPSLTLASEARPSSSPVSHPSRGTSSSHVSWAESLMGTPAHSSISEGTRISVNMNFMEEEELGGHGQLYDSAVLHLLSGIDGIDELKKHYDLQVGEMASRLKEADDTATMLRKQVEEQEVKLSMANMPERRLIDMVCTSEDGHARTKKELALMREKMDEANRRIEYLEAEVSKYQNRIVEAEREKEKAEARASRASNEGGTMSTPHPSSPAPWSTALSFFPLLLQVSVSQTWRSARKALFFLNLTSFLDHIE
ncbi:hypothetical protein BT93_H2547 [Corymbia citriodora subsp. variegata]|nr:hypothetical protein BT93_H2547 [Corymbia citriodora subsp. variegata]